MNSFLELYSSSDYRVSERDYHTSTWEYVCVASDYLIPFQFETTASDYRVYTIDTAGAETEITNDLDVAQLISGWTAPGGGLTTAGAQILDWQPDTGEYIYSNNFTLTSGDIFHLNVLKAGFNNYSDMVVRLYKGAASVWSYPMNVFTGVRYAITSTASDYAVRFTNENAGGRVCETDHTPWAAVSNIEKDGNYNWYNGAQILSAVSGIFRLRIDTSFFSDWCDTLEFTGKAKIKLESTYDYGSIKYDSGYEQWMYKDATIRRDPKAEVVITGDTLNGKRINEKITSAVRYTMRMKCTESEFEALVHGLGATVTITDSDSKEYDAQNIALSDPAMSRTNGIVELSFIDGNNINVSVRNNTSL